jgi:hypothetical protein
VTTSRVRNPVLVAGIAIGVVLGAAALLGDAPPWTAVLSAAIPIGYAVVVTLIAPRSDTASVLAGRPVDERAEHLELVASSWALGISAAVVLASFVVAQASRADAVPYAFMAAVIGVAYLGSLLVLRARH